MSQCRMHIFSVTECRFITAAVRQMVINKTLDQLFINTFDINIDQDNPVSKMSQSCKVVINGIGCIAAVKQVQHERINVGYQWAINQPTGGVVIGIH